MKTAEEWATAIRASLGNGLRFGPGVQPHGSIISQAVKQIQWSALTTAADQIIDDGNPELARKRILDLRDAL